MCLETRSRFSLAHLTLLDVPPPELVEVAARAGYDLVGLRLISMNRPGEPRYPLAEAPGLLRRTKRALAETGVRLLDVEVAQITEDFDPRGYLPPLDVAAELGAQFVLASAWTPDQMVVIRGFAALCDLARPFGLTVMLEFMRFSDVSTLKQAIEVVRRCRRSNAGILVDALHFHFARTRLSDLADVPANWLPYVHLCDGPGKIPATLQGLRRIARRERLFPGEGDIDVAGIVNQLPANITYAIEAPNPARVKALGVEEYARRSFETAKRFLDTHRPQASSALLRLP